MTPSTHSCRSSLETSLRRNTSYGTYSCGFAAVTARAYQDPSASPAWRLSSLRATAERLRRARRTRRVTGPGLAADGASWPWGLNLQAPARNANTTDAAECGGEGSCVCAMSAERVVSIARIEVRPVRRQGAAVGRKPGRRVGAPPGDGEARDTVGRVGHDDALARGICERGQDRRTRAVDDDQTAGAHGAAQRRP